MRKPRINLMIMREGETDQAVRSYSLPGYAPRLAIIAAVVLAILLTIFGAAAIYLWQGASDVLSLRSENEALRESMTRLAQLESELQYHREFTRRVAGLVGVDVPSLQDSLDTDPGYLAGDSALPGPYGQMTGSPDDASPAAGILVVNCRPDPNNRPRGLPVMGRLSRGFHPAAANPQLRHQGIDIATREGSPVFAPASGTVTFAGDDEVYGLMLIIDHGDGFETVYGHNSKLLAQQGARINRADVIALSGNTGVSTAPHLHYEIRKDDRPVDPIGFLGRAVP